MSALVASTSDIASFYHYAVEHELIDTDAPARWADQVIEATDVPDIRVIEVALTAGRPRRQVMEALRPLFTEHSTTTVRMIAQLFRQLQDQGERSAAFVAGKLYALTFCMPAAEVFGSEIYAIDEVFEPWMMGQTPAAAAYVRKFLDTSGPVPLPPL